MASDTNRNLSTVQRTSRTRNDSDSIETLNELASFLPKEYLNLRKTDTIPKKDEYLHKTATLTKPYLTTNVAANSSSKEQSGHLSISSSASELLPPQNKFTRSSSLRSSLRRSPSSNTKKIVRFADSMGLDLEQVSHVHSEDSKITTIFVPYNPTSSSKPRFAPLFLLPSVMKIDRLLETQQVCLESVAVGGYFVKGVIKVKNLAYEKKVTIRYTTDDWASFTDTCAAYIRNSSDGFTDKFSFKIDLTNKSDTQLTSLDFAIRYVALNVGEFWDSNHSRNYQFRYEDQSKKTLVTEPSWYDDAWLHFN